jgi:YbgC/YbaW family acyl-CoA thioester hydrolase
MPTTNGTTPKPRFEISRKIRWRDTDRSGTANLGAYIRLMEETEYAFLRSRGLCVVLHDERGTIGFPRINASVNLERPARFDEQVWVTLELSQIDGKQIVYQFEIVDDAAQLLAVGRFKVACCRFPDDEPPFAILIPEYVMEALSPSPLVPRDPPREGE